MHYKTKYLDYSAMNLLVNMSSKYFQKRNAKLRCCKTHINQFTIVRPFYLEDQSKDLNWTEQMSQSKVLHLYRVSLFINNGEHNTAKKQLPNFKKRTDKTFRH